MPRRGVGAERDKARFISLDLARAENDIVEENLFTGPRVSKSSFHWPVEKGARLNQIRKGVRGVGGRRGECWKGDAPEIINRR